jgi:molecular chaperone DnaJ
MIKGIIGKLGTAASRSLFSRGKYSFYNEVPKFDPQKNYYDILGVNKNTSDADLKRSYYQLAKKYHPDSNPGLEAKFKEINEAYTVLSDPKVKRQYDSARLVSGFSRKMGDKAGQGTWNYQ